MLKRGLVSLALALAPFAVHAQTPPLAVHRAAGSIVIDGKLDEAGWKEAALIDRFYETSPGDNTPPKVKTTTWVTYDERYFYIGVRCDDPEPAKIRAPFVDRDAVIGTDDNIAVFLDTRNDKRSAIELRRSATISPTRTFDRWLRSAACGTTSAPRSSARCSPIASCSTADTIAFSVPTFSGGRMTATR
ncbi:MAG: hypothetical protein QOI24_83 [Acidobacteriota bacterium]|jgi:hypothetical protein|nr:hypothetical protein [Acidobacteriota bacterium]